MSEGSSAEHGCPLHSLLITRALFYQGSRGGGGGGVLGPVISTPAEHAWESPKLDTTFPPTTSMGLKAPEPHTTCLSVPLAPGASEPKTHPNAETTPDLAPQRNPGIRSPNWRESEEGKVILSSSILLPIHPEPHQLNHKWDANAQENESQFPPLCSKFQRPPSTIKDSCLWRLPCSIPLTQNKTYF